MSSRRARINARAVSPGWPDLAFLVPITTKVEVDVTFDHGDHEHALKALDEAVDDVRRQITEATTPPPPPRPTATLRNEGEGYL